MKLRKVLATTLAIAMAALAIPAVPAQADVIDGQAAYLNTEIYDVTLPTTSSQKFYLDPQNLSGTVLGVDNGGKIIGATTMSAINSSSKPINFEVKANVVASSPSAITVVTDSAVDLSTYDNVASAPAIRLDITATKGTLDGAAPVTEGAIGTGTTALTSKTTGVAASGAGITTMTYGMAPAGYKIVTKGAIDTSKLDEVFDSSKYDYVKSTTGSSIDFVIGGECTKQTDWSAFSDGTQTLKLDITFKVTKADGTTEVTAGGAAGFAQSSYTYDKSNAQDITCTAYAPSEVTVTETALVANKQNNLAFEANQMIIVPAAAYTYDATTNTVTLKHASWKNYPNGNYGLGIRFNNSAEYTYWTHITIQD